MQEEHALKHKGYRGYGGQDTGVSGEKTPNGRQFSGNYIPLWAGPQKNALNPRDQSSARRLLNGAHRKLTPKPA